MSTAERKATLQSLRKDALSHVAGHEKSLKAKEPRVEPLSHMHTDMDILPEDENVVAEDLSQLDLLVRETLSLRDGEEDALTHPLWSECCRRSETALNHFLLNIFAKVVLFAPSTDKVMVSEELELAYNFASELEGLLLQLLDGSKKTLWHHFRIPFLANDDAVDKPIDHNALLHEEFVFKNIKRQYFIIQGAGRRLERLVKHLGLDIEIPDWVHDIHQVSALGENRFDAPYDSSTFHLHAEKQQQLFLAHAKPGTHIAEMVNKIEHLAHHHETKAEA